MMRRASAVCIVLALAASASAREAWVEIVELADGSVYQGTLVERVPSDHVTIELAGGGIRRFEWAEIKEAHEARVRESTARSEVYVQNWPEPDRRPPVLSQPHLTAGIAAGIGGPEGYFGVTGGWEPSSWFELEVGAGTGGTFGPALAETVRLGLPLFTVRVGLGVGLSQNLVGGSYTSQGAPPIAHWLNLESFTDFVLGRRWLLRWNMGSGHLLNSGGFAVMCRGARAPSDCTDWGIPTTPSSAGGGWAFDLYGSVRLGWLFDI
jgi:hypothetical protein